MSLFTVKQVGFDGTLVVGAAHAVAADGWWVFQDADGRPLAALPMAEVDAIESIPEDDARGRAWRHAPVPAVRKTKPWKERPSAPRRRLWSGVLASLNPARAHLRQTTGRRIPSPFGLRRPRAALHGPGFGRRPYGVDAQHRVEVRVAARSDQVGETPVTQEGSCPVDGPVGHASAPWLLGEVPGRTRDGATTDVGWCRLGHGERCRPTSGRPVPGTGCTGPPRRVHDERDGGRRADPEPGHRRRRRRSARGGTRCGRGRGRRVARTQRI